MDLDKEGYINYNDIGTLKEKGNSRLDEAGSAKLQTQAMGS